MPGNPFLPVICAILSVLIGMDRSVFEKYVLSPRIADENLSDWRGFLREKMEPITRTC